MFGIGQTPEMVRSVSQLENLWGCGATTEIVAKCVSIKHIFHDYKLHNTVNLSL